MVGKDTKRQSLPMMEGILLQRTAQTPSMIKPYIDDERTPPNPQKKRKEAGERKIIGKVTCY
jgi:hypothetical protein